MDVPPLRATLRAMVDSTWQGLRPTDPVEPGLLALLDGLPGPAALLDDQGSLLRANPALRALIGPSLPLRPGLPATALVPPPARASLATWLESPDPVPLEAPLTTPDDHPPRHALLRLLPLPGGTRALLVEDLSDRARQREEAEATERLRAIGQLAGGIAHDINNLLSIIHGALDATRTATPATTDSLQPAQDAADRGAALVRRLLAFARRQQLAPRILDLDDSITGAAPLLRTLLGPGIILNIHPGALGRRIRVDPSQLDQVLLNLAANARDAMAGQGTLTIATDTTIALQEEPGLPDALPPGRWTVLDVTDTGPGIPPELLPRIFEPFFTTKAGQGGTGLGLATVHGIVRQSGGALQLHTRPGQTRFRIHLPRHEGEPEPAPPPPAPAQAEPTHRHILLVDDEAPLRRLAATALERAGHRVTQAEDGDSALELLDSGLQPGAIVSDIAMPGLDGIALARAARARQPHLPVVLMSGYAEAALDQDMTGDNLHFLSKPYRPAQLVEMVAKLP
ncbi:ATP-binding protein [Roseomonas chloroacetimidivorans]|uniref:ATP-binding protein n=1 Tax=Roseomonas chloroacetimidivorans TaxID=1766656 RepID=UPI003C765171